jgi:copper(I)-binding protein
MRNCYGESGGFYELPGNSVRRPGWIAVGLLALAAACNETRAQPPGPQSSAASSLTAPALSVAARTDAGEIAISDAWVQLTPKPTLAVAYLTLRNAGKQGATLKSVSGDVAEHIELHESVLEGGVMRMVAHPEGFEVPAAGELRLERGGKHVMLIGVKKPLEAGSSVSLTLALSGNREIVVHLPVRDATRPDGQ